MTGRNSIVPWFGALIFLVSFAGGAEARKVQMAVATFSQSVLPMVVAREKGYFRDEDLDVELILMTASVANMALMGRQRRFHFQRSERGRRHRPRRSAEICFPLF